MKNGNEGMPVATVGEMRYGPNFVKKFLRSCETPIVITKNDTPEIAELKKAVIDAKIELKARYDAGEDISEIMNQTRRDLVELGNVRHLDLKIWELCLVIKQHIVRPALTAGHRHRRMSIKRPFGTRFTQFRKRR